MSRLSSFLFKKIDPTGLAVFRILFCLVLWFEVRQLYEFSPIIYEKIPFLEKGEFYPEFIYSFWKIVLVFLIFGWFTRILTIVNYALCVSLLSGLVAFEYHVHYAYVGTSLLLIFLPVSNVLSIDALFHKIRYGILPNSVPQENKVFKIYYFIPVIIGIGFVYLDSVFYKLVSPIWMKGLGMWLPSSMSFATINDHFNLNDYRILVKFLGYFTIFFETIFLFLFWHKSFRTLLLIIGLGLHLGILIEFPIPWFALTACVIYILLVPVSWWKKTRSIFPKPSLVVYFNSENLPSRIAMQAASHFDIFNQVHFTDAAGGGMANNGINWGTQRLIILNDGKMEADRKVLYRIWFAMVWLAPFTPLLMIGWVARKVSIAIDQVTYLLSKKVVSQIGPKNSSEVAIDQSIERLQRKFWYTILAFLTVIQSIVSLNSDIPSRLILKSLSRIGADIPNRISRFSKATESWAVDYFGITHHQVFSDIHFDGYNHIYRIAFVEPSGKEINLPLLDEKGMPGSYNQGAFWVNYTFRTTGNYTSWPQYSYWISRYARFWLAKNHRSTVNQHFKIYVTKVAAPTDWQEGFLENYIQNIKWTEAAILTINMKNDSLSPIIKVVEDF